MTHTTAIDHESLEALRAPLLPCPFCGGPVSLEKAGREQYGPNGPRQFWGIICRNTINLGGTCAIQQIPSASPAAAVARWNRRETIIWGDLVGLREQFDAVFLSLNGFHTKAELNHAWENLHGMLFRAGAAAKIQGAA